MPGISFLKFQVIEESLYVFIGGLFHKKTGTEVTEITWLPVLNIYVAKA